LKISGAGVRMSELKPDEFGGGIIAR
jgi:hypothetical protein